MFYGIPPAKHDAFRKALETLQEIYPNQIYAQDMLICLSKRLSFQGNSHFMESFKAIARDDQERSLLWRLHTLVWAAENALRVEGDFVECGVLKGFSSAVLCKYLGFERLPRAFYLFDTFAGLPEEASSEKERKGWNRVYGAMDSESWYEAVRESFSAYPNVRIVRGAVPHSFSQAVPDRIAFLHLDLNSEQAEVGALEALFDRISPGGVIVLDDFGWQFSHHTGLAESRFLESRGHSVLELPTGQGLVLKHAGGGRPPG